MIDWEENVHQLLFEMVLPRLGLVLNGQPRFTSQSEPGSLDHLATLDIDFGPRVYVVPVSLTTRILALPALQTIRLHRARFEQVVDDDTGTKTHTLMGTTSVRHIVLSYSTITGPILTYFLGLPRELRSFTCSYLTNSGGGELFGLSSGVHDRELFDLIFAALASQASTLKALSIDQPLTPARCLDSMRHLWALEKVVLGGRALEVQLTDVNPGLPFEQIMPPKLRELHVRTHFCHPAQSGLVRKLAETTMTFGLPTKVTFFVPNTSGYGKDEMARISDAIRDVCQDLGTKPPFQISMEEDA
jgi:hypothetical protein